MEIRRLKLKIPWPFFSVNVFLVGARGEYILIDAGFPSEQNFQELWNFVSSDAGSLERIKYIILTHGHPDHYGNLPSILFQKNIPVVVHPEDKDRVVQLPKEEREEAAKFAFEFLTKNGVPEDKLHIIHRQSKSYFTRKYQVNEDNVIFLDRIDVGGLEFKIIHVPGHTPGHILLYLEKDGIAFAGDHIFSRGFPVPLLFFPKKQDRFRNLPNWLKSLEVFETLDVKKVFPGHLEEFENIQDVVAKMKNRVMKMEDKILNIISYKPMTIYEIGESLYPSVPDEFWSFKFSEAQGYVDILEEKGAISSFEHEGKILFRKL